MFSPVRFARGPLRGQNCPSLFIGIGRSSLDAGRQIGRFRRQLSGSSAESSSCFNIVVPDRAYIEVKGKRKAVEGYLQGICTQDIRKLRRTGDSVAGT